jgi:hypothetical protein
VGSNEKKAHEIGGLKNDNCNIYYLDSNSTVTSEYRITIRRNSSGGGGGGGSIVVVVVVVLWWWWR